MGQVFLFTCAKLSRQGIFDEGIITGRAHYHFSSREISNMAANSNDFVRISLAFVRRNNEEIYLALRYIQISHYQKSVIK